jgi:diguanylate cyclase (GGDEF)-like protein/PAS domain S-box-containing protein
MKSKATQTSPIAFSEVEDANTRIRSIRHYRRVPHHANPKGQTRCRVVSRTEPADSCHRCNNRGVITFLAVLLAFTFILSFWIGARAQRRLHEAQALAATREREVADILNASSEAFVSLDAEGAITSWSSNAERLLGWSAPEVMGKKMSDTVIPEDHRRAYEENINTWSAGTRSAIVGHRVETAALHRDGHEQSVEMMMWARRNGGFNAFIHEIDGAAPEQPDVPDRRAATVLIDPLTSLGNRQLLEKDLAIYEGQVARYGLRSCVALIDIDNFKRFNERYGREKGDEVIVAIAEQLTSHSRSGDAIYRVGGDEFICLLPDQTLETGAVAVARIRRNIAELAIPDEDSPTGFLTVSAGLALLDVEHLKASAELLKDAESSLFRTRDGESTPGESDGTEGPTPSS